MAFDPISGIVGPIANLVTAGLERLPPPDPAGRKAWKLARETAELAGRVGFLEERLAWFRSEGKAPKRTAKFRALLREAREKLDELTASRPLFIGGGRWRVVANTWRASIRSHEGAGGVLLDPVTVQQLEAFLGHMTSSAGFPATEQAAGLLREITRRKQPEAWAAAFSTAHREHDLTARLERDED